MAAGDILEMVVRGFSGGIKFNNTFHYEMDPGVVGPPDLPSFSAAFIAAVANQMALVLTADYIFDTLTTTNVSGPSGRLQYVDASIGGSPGSAAGPSEDFAYCAVIRRSDPFASRTGRGRVFISPVSNTVFDTAGILLTPATFTNLIAAVLAPLVDGFATNYFPCLFNPTGPAVTRITTTGISPIAGIRKHRRAAL